VHRPAGVGGRANGGARRRCYGRAQRPSSAGRRRRSTDVDGRGIRNARRKNRRASRLGHPPERERLPLIGRESPGNCAKSGDRKVIRRLFGGAFTPEAIPLESWSAGLLYHLMAICKDLPDFSLSTKRSV